MDDELLQPHSQADVQILIRAGAILRAKNTGSGHARTCPVVDIVKATQQGAGPVRCGCRLGCTRWGHIGITWRIRLNRLCAAAMRPYVKLH